MTETSIEQNSGAVVSGTVNGDARIGGSVVIHMPAPAPQPPPETASNGERIRFITAAIMAMQADFINLRGLVEADRQERQTRQAQADRYRSIQNMMIVALVVLMSILLMVVLWWVSYFNDRFGWL